MQDNITENVAKLHFLPCEECCGSGQTEDWRENSDDEWYCVNVMCRGCRGSGLSQLLRCEDCGNYEYIACEVDAYGRGFEYLDTYHSEGCPTCRDHLRGDDLRDCMSHSESIVEAQMERYDERIDAEEAYFDTLNDIEEEE